MFLKNCCRGMAMALLLATNALADDAQMAEGQELYGEFCQNCHGPDRSGLEVFTGGIDGLTDRLEGFTDEMPDFTGFFEEDEIAALNAYLSAPNNQYACNLAKLARQIDKQNKHVD